MTDKQKEDGQYRNWKKRVDKETGGKWSLIFSHDSKHALLMSHRVTRHLSDEEYGDIQPYMERQEKRNLKNQEKLKGVIKEVKVRL